MRRCPYAPPKQESQPHPQNMKDTGLDSSLLHGVGAWTLGKLQT